MKLGMLKGMGMRFSKKTANKLAMAHKGSFALFFKMAAHSYRICNNITSNMCTKVILVFKSMFLGRLHLMATSKIV